MSYKQKKLTRHSIKLCSEASDAIHKCLTWGCTPEGHKYWCDIYERLNQSVRHGTNDGKPWVEPNYIPPDPYADWVVPTDEDAIGRPDCIARDSDQDEWQHVKLVAVGNMGVLPFNIIDKHGSIKMCKTCLIHPKDKK